MKIKEWIDDTACRWVVYTFSRRAFDAGYVYGSQIELAEFDGRSIRSKASSEHQQQCYDEWLETDAE
jgi:hypothetical protein